MIDLISLTGLAGSGASIYGAISAIKSGGDINDLINNINNIDDKIERISDSISILHEDVLRDVTAENQIYYKEIDVQKELLSPIQEILQSEILSSIPLKTPNVLQRGLEYNPRDILLNIDKLEDTELTNTNNLIPILFQENNNYYVGWQMLSTASILFDLDIKSNSLGFYNKGNRKKSFDSPLLDADTAEFYRKRVQGADPVAQYDLAVIFYIGARDVEDVLYARELLVKSAKSGYELSKIRLESLNTKLLSSAKY